MIKIKALFLAVLAVPVFAIPSAAQVTTNGGTLEAIAPFRVLDTRPSKGGSGPLAGNQEYVLPILGQGATPSYGVSAIFGIVTVVAGASGGYLTIYPTGTPRPLASNINFAPGQVIANQFLVPVGSNGSITIYNSEYSAGVNVIIDINGWIAASVLAPVGPTIAFDPQVLTNIDTLKARIILQNTTRYAMTTWWNGPAQTLLAQPLVQGSDPTDAVRRLSMQALGLSTALATGVYDETSAQLLEATAVTRLKILVNTVASQHISNHANGWGASWQSPMWTGLIARAAWFNWSDMSEQTKTYVANMVASEADYAARQKIKYYADATGTIINSGDSGAEEVSWMSNALQVALVMFPNHPNQFIWASTLVQFSLAAWARPEDVTSSTVVNGAPLSAWLKGSNVVSNGVIMNHNRIASDYSTTIYQTLDTAPLFVFANYTVPQAVKQLLAPVYAAFTGVPFGGGTTYVLDSADIYYPQPNDWGSGQKLPYALADALALVYGFDSGSAAEYLNLHMDAQLAMQNRFDDKRTYANDAEYNYIGREEHTAQLASQLYLALYMRDHDLVSFSNNNYWLG